MTGYKDITPRGGVAWDVFGTGKTSMKVNAGKYLQAAQNGLSYAALRPTRTADDDRRRGRGPTRDGDFVPDCDLLNPLANNGGDFCAQISDLGFGSERFTSDARPTSW